MCRPHTDLSFRANPCRWGTFVAGTLVALCVAAASAAQNATQDQGIATLRAGAATSNITPPLGEPIVGGWQPTPARQIHDELHARCLVLDDGETRLAIVLADNVGIPREVFDAAKKLIYEETGLPSDHVLIAATHTHSATSARTGNRLVPPEEFTPYQQFLIRRLADGVRRAINNLEPARIGWGTATEPREMFNRRWFLKPDAEQALRNPFGGHDQVRMNPPRADPDLLRPAGPTDPQIIFLSLQSRDGRPLALLANYSLHYVGGTGPAEVSADYFGIFASSVGELLGAEKSEPPFVGILSNGTSGDVNNIDFRHRGQRMRPYEKMRQVADRVARQVYDAHQNIEFHDAVKLAAVAQELTLGIRKPTDEQLAYFRDILKKPEDAEPYHGRERIYADRVQRQLESPDEVSVILQTLRIGDVGIAAIPFEVFAEMGLEIKEKSPFHPTFTIELANGSYGYLPTPRQHELGGYETWLGTNLVEKRASEKITHAVLDMFATLKDGE